MLVQITSKRTSSKDWKLKSADCEQISFCNPPSHSYLGFKLTISELSGCRYECFEVLARVELLFDVKFTVVLQNDIGDVY